MQAAVYQRQFEHFAAHECSEDPLYVALCRLLAQRPGALHWLDAAAPVQRRPNLLLAAIHDRVLAGAGGALSGYFASVDGHRSPDDDLPAALDALLADQQDALREAIGRHGTQTNEIGRCAVLWPALGEIARRCGGRPLALLDFGCSAGLNLAVDRCTYSYAGRPASTLLGAAPGPDVPLIDCHPLHGRAPPAPDPGLQIARRQGLDLNPVDVRDPTALRWLRACLWPQDRERRRRFDQAAAIVARQAWPLERADDGVAAIERWLDAVQADDAGRRLQPVVFNSWVLTYFGADDLAAHVARLRVLVQQRGLAWLSAEAATLRQGEPAEPGPGDARVGTGELARGTQWWLTLPGDGAPQAHLLARSHPHGRWVQWVARDKAPVPAGSIIPDPSSKRKPAMFQHIQPYAGDPIFALVDAFHADPRPQKVNLSIGIYFDEQGRLPVLPSVQAAEQRILAEGGAKPYLPMEGDAAARREVQALLLGRDHPAIAAGRVATIQTVGSSGGLKVGADFLKTWLPDSAVWVSDPTWDNHRSMFEGSGFTVHAYPYYDASTGGVRFDDMLSTLRACPPRSIVLLHACCHNPTGVDLARAQWDALIPVLRERELLAYLDLAYQGFGDGIAEDAYAVRALADAGLTFFVANSFSKSMSVYGERCGALSAVCADKAEAELVMGQLRFTVRRIYSSPALHAAKIVSHVLGDADLRPMWETELGAMRERIAAMRRALHASLVARLPGRDFGYFLTQRGMFSYTGLSAAQVDRLREEHAVYLIRSGRICVAGLNNGNVERTAAAMAAVIGAS